MSMRKAVLTGLIAALISGAAGAGTIEELNRLSAGNDMAKLRQQVNEFARLVEAEVETHGVEAAIAAFRNPPWRRDANALHIWGVTRKGVDWFDSAYPEFEGLDITEMSDLNGLDYLPLIFASADGSGEKIFEATFLHPVLKTAAQAAEQCFPVKDSDRILCAGGLLDPK